MGNSSKKTMMMVSGNTKHMVHDISRLTQKILCNVDIALLDDPKVIAPHKGNRSFTWSTFETEIDVSMRDKLF